MLKILIYFSSQTLKINKYNFVNLIKLIDNKWYIYNNMFQNNNWVVYTGWHVLSSISIGKHVWYAKTFNIIGLKCLYSFIIKVWRSKYIKILNIYEFQFHVKIQRQKIHLTILKT